MTTTIIMSGRAAGAGAGLRGVDSGTHSVSLRASERGRDWKHEQALTGRLLGDRAAREGFLSFRSKKSSRGGVHSNSGPIYHQKTPAVELPLPLAKARYLSINRQPVSRGSLDWSSWIWFGHRNLKNPRPNRSPRNHECVAPGLGRFSSPSTILPVQS